MKEAIEAYTIGPAHAAGLHDRLGRLTPGYLADLIVLDTDPFTCDQDVIKDIQVMATMVDGDWVHNLETT
jgi:predicted amidohydrolase YtcJ